jgi:hypothetical protein
MKAFVLLGFLTACAAHARATDPAGDDAPPIDGAVDSSVDDQKPDAPAPVLPCATAPWSIETFDQYVPVDGATQPVQPYIRSGASGLEVAYATNPSAGEQRRIATRSPAGSWSFTTEGTRVTGTVARGVDSHGVESQCSTDGPAVVNATSQLVFSCGTRTVGGTWTMTMLGGNGTTSNPSLVIDPADRVHVTYDLGATDYYAWRDPGGAWTTEVLGPRSSQYSPLAVDAAGCVHIARVTRDSSYPEYAVMHGTRCPGATTWTWEAVVREYAFHWIGAHALAFDTLGRLHVVYMGRRSGVDSSDYALIHGIRGATGTWTRGLADGVTDPIVVSDAVTSDLSGGVWIGYMPKLASYNTSFMAEKVVLHVAADGTTERHSFGPALYGGSVVPFVDPSRRVHVVIDSGSKTLEYATTCPEAPVR